MGCILSLFRFGTYIVKEPPENYTPIHQSQAQTQSHQHQQESRRKNGNHQEQESSEPIKPPKSRSKSKVERGDQTAVKEPVLFTTTFETQVDAAPPHPLEQALEENNHDNNQIEIETDLYTPEVEDAVVKIQAGLRGYLTRKALKENTPPKGEDISKQKELIKEDIPIVPPPSNFKDEIADSKNTAPELPSDATLKTKPMPLKDICITNVPSKNFPIREVLPKEDISPAEVSFQKEDKQINKELETCHKQETAPQIASECPLNVNLGLVPLIQETSIPSSRDESIAHEQQLNLHHESPHQRGSPQPMIQIEQTNGAVFDEEEAAIKIQAAFRGYQTRKGLSRETSPVPAQSISAEEPIGASACPDAQSLIHINGHQLEQIETLLIQELIQSENNHSDLRVQNQVIQQQQLPPPPPPPPQEMVHVHVLHGDITYTSSAEVNVTTPPIGESNNFETISLENDNIQNEEMLKEQAKDNEIQVLAVVSSRKSSDADVKLEDIVLSEIMIEKSQSEEQQKTEQVSEKPMINEDISLVPEVQQNSSNDEKSEFLPILETDQMQSLIFNTNVPTEVTQIQTENETNIQSSAPHIDQEPDFFQYLSDIPQKSENAVIEPEPESLLPANLMELIHQEEEEIRPESEKQYDSNYLQMHAPIASTSASASNTQNTSITNQSLALKFDEPIFVEQSDALMKNDEQRMDIDQAINSERDLRDRFYIDLESPSSDSQLVSSPEDILSMIPDEDVEIIGTALSAPIPVRASSPNPFGKKKRRGRKGHGHSSGAKR